METLEAGYGAEAEFHTLHHEPDGTPCADRAELSHRIAAAAEIAGIGLTLLPVLYEAGGCDERTLEGGQRRFGNDPDGYARLLDGAKAALRDLPDAVLGVAPHSLRAVTGPGLEAARALAGRGPLHMHLAEPVAEVEEVQGHLGARPVEWLLANAPVGPAWCLIHCTQMTGAETAALAATGAVAGLCPITEASLGDGIFNGTDYFAAGGRAGFGTDSNGDISLFRELCALDCSQRLRDLSDSGIVERRRQGGTHVRADPVTRARPDIPIVRREVEAAGAAHGNRLIAQAERGAPAEVLARFGLRTPRRMLNVEAVHLADGLPYIAENCWGSPETVPGILGLDLTR